MCSLRFRPPVRGERNLRLGGKAVNSFQPDDARLPKRFRIKFEIRDCGYATPCWAWIAGKGGKGYGQFQEKTKKAVSAHLYCYRVLVGPVPDGLTLDHLCRNRCCCNPAHVEPVTLGENVLRGVGDPAQNARKTHCKHGHPFSGSNLYIEKMTGYRVCRVCHLRLTAAYRLKKKGGSSETV